jgi:hypothetical protein
MNRICSIDRSEYWLGGCHRNFGRYLGRKDRKDRKDRTDRNDRHYAFIKRKCRCGHCYNVVVAI